MATTDWSKYGGSATPPPANTDWSKYGGAKPAAGAPPPPPALDTGYGAVSGTNVDAQKLAAPVKKLVTATSQALDFQRERLARKYTGTTGYEAQTEVLRHRIPPLQAFHDFHAPATGIGPIDALQHGADSLANNLMDAAMWYPLDPTTWETFGAGKVAETPVGMALRAATRAKVAKTLNNTMAGKLIYKHLGPWGGTVAAARGAAANDIGKGLADVETAQGAGHAATAEGQRWEAMVGRRVGEIVNGQKPSQLTKKSGAPVKMAPIKPNAALNDAERMRVMRALRDDELVPGAEGQYEAADGPRPHSSTLLTPKELTAYRQLRSLTALDWKQGQRAATAYAIRTRIPDAEIRAEVQNAFRTGKPPEIPAPGKLIKKPYGEPVGRSRGTYAAPEDLHEEWARATEGMDESTKLTLVKYLNAKSFKKELAPQYLNQLEPADQASASILLRKVAEQYQGRPISIQELEAKPRYKMVPENQAEIDKMGKAHAAYMGVLGDVASQQEGGLLHFRENYMPFAHEDFGDPLGREGFSANPAVHSNPRLLKEQGETRITNPGQLERGFIKGLAPNLNRQVQTRVLNEAIPDLLQDKNVEDLFKSEVRATGQKRTPEQWFSDVMRAVVGFPRAALVSMTPGHAVNETIMAINTVPLEHQPKFFKDAFGLAAKIFAAQVKGDTKEYAALTKPGRELGAGVGSFAERKAFYQDLPGSKIPVLGLPLKGLAAYTRFNNKLVWSISEAIRQKYAEYLVEHGEAKGLQAGGLAEKRLVDYQYRTPFQNFMRNIAPFGTYRGGIPGAVSGGVLRRPAQAAFLSRATGGTFYGDKPEPGQPGWEGFFPTAEVGRLFNAWPTKRGEDFGPIDYAEGSLSPAIAAPVGLGIAALQARQNGKAIQSNPLAYGQPWLPKRLPDGRLDLGYLLMSALSGVPEAQAVLEANGISRYHWRGALSEFMRQAGRVQYTPAAAPVGPSTILPPLPTGGANPLAPQSSGTDWTQYGGKNP